MPGWTPTESRPRSKPAGLPTVAAPSEPVPPPSRTAARSPAISPHTPVCAAAPARSAQCLHRGLFVFVTVLVVRPCPWPRRPRSLLPRHRRFLGRASPRGACAKQLRRHGRDLSRATLRGSWCCSTSSPRAPADSAGLSSARRRTRRLDRCALLLVVPYRGIRQGRDSGSFGNLVVVQTARLHSGLLGDGRPQSLPPSTPGRIACSSRWSSASPPSRSRRWLLASRCWLTALLSLGLRRHVLLGPAWPRRSRAPRRRKPPSTILWGHGDAAGAVISVAAFPRKRRWPGPLPMLRRSPGPPPWPGDSYGVLTCAAAPASGKSDDPNLAGRGPDRHRTSSLALLPDCSLRRLAEPWRTAASVSGRRGPAIAGLVVGATAVGRVWGILAACIGDA
jgi:hypothetical protein